MREDKDTKVFCLSIFKLFSMENEKVRDGAVHALLGLCSERYPCEERCQRMCRRRTLLPTRMMRSPLVGTRRGIGSWGYVVAGEEYAADGVYFGGGRLGDSGGNGGAVGGGDGGFIVGVGGVDVGCVTYHDAAGFGCFADYVRTPYTVFVKGGSMQ